MDDAMGSRISHIITAFPSYEMLRFVGNRGRERARA
jgi:hypothetical protein